MTPFLKIKNSHFKLFLGKKKEVDIAIYFLKIANPFAQLECTEFTIWEGLRTLLVLLITWVIIAVVSALIAPSGGVGGGGLLRNFFTR